MNRPIEPEAPACGHSVCSQNFIDTGEVECIDNDDPTPYELDSEENIPADDAHRAQESMRFKR